MMSSETRSRQQSRHLPAFVLLVLAETPMHGGAMQSALNSRLPSLKADSAAIYRTLKQLEKDGQLLAEWDTSGSGPAIRVYRLTPRGWEKLDSWLEDVKERIANLQHFVDTYAKLRRPTP
jgi:DNA-binding PadR family transcriptional regulator